MRQGTLRNKNLLSNKIIRIVRLVFMTPELAPLPSNQDCRILCCYFNATSKIQIVRITNIPNWYFERTVFPKQRLLFEALPDAQMEVHIGMLNSTILSNEISCDFLRVN